MKDSGMTRVERLLSSSRGRALFCVALAAIVSLVVTAPHVEVAGLRGRDVDLVEIYFEQLIIWGAWSLLLWPITALAAWLIRKTGSWVAFVAVMIPLSLVTSYGFLHLGYVVQKPTEVEIEKMRAEFRRFREERRGGAGGFMRAGALDAEEGRAGQRSGGRGRGGPGQEGRQRDGGGSGDGTTPGEGRSPEVGGQVRPRPAGPDWQHNRWGQMRAMLEVPNLSLRHWRMRWIQEVLVFWVLLGMGGGLLSFLGMRRKERHASALELRTSELRGQLADAKLDTLKGQLQPHFLFNALHSVGGLIRAGEQQQALKTLAAIGQLLRSTLDLEQESEIRLEDELTIARRYLAIEQIRFGDRLQVEVSTGESLGDALIPTLLLLPLVENAVKYGVAPQTEGGKVSVDVSREGDSVLLIVRDDGAGFPEQVLGGATSSAERRSIGLENTRGRLQALYGEAQLFELRNADSGGAEVRIELPYHLSKNEEGWPLSHD